MKRVLLVTGLLLATTYVVGGPFGCAPADNGGVTGGTGGTTTGMGGATTGMGGTTTGTGGSTTGTGGSTTGAGGSMTGTGGMTVLTDVAKPINGVLVTSPCVTDVSNGGSVCDTRQPGAACPDTTNADLPLRGIKTFDKTYTLAGARGTMYSIALHVQGEVEAKQYTGGTDQNTAKVSPAADGFYFPTTGDTTRVVTGTYNVYLFRVTNPAGAKRDYFLNAIQPPGVQNHTTYGIDYMATVVAEGGSTVRIVSSDSNCQMIRNCGPTENDGSRCAAPIIMTPEADVRTANPTVDFTRAYDGQWIGITVKTVTQM